MFIIKILRTIGSYYFYFSIPHSTTLVSLFCNISFREVFFLHMMSCLSYFGRSSDGEGFFSARLPRHPHRIQLFIGSVMIALDFSDFWWFSRCNNICWFLIRTRWLDGLIIMVVDVIFDEMFTRTVEFLMRSSVFCLHI